MVNKEFYDWKLNSFQLEKIMHGVWNWRQLHTHQCFSDTKSPWRGLPSPDTNPGKNGNFWWWLQTQQVGLISLLQKIRNAAGLEERHEDLLALRLARRHTIRLQQKRRNFYIESKNNQIIFQSTNRPVWNNSGNPCVRHVTSQGLSHKLISGQPFLKTWRVSRT